MPHGLFSRFLRNRRGSTIIEFAVVAPVFFLIFLGIFEFGLYMFHKIAIEAITMQASREASLGRQSAEAGCGPDRVAYVKCFVKKKSAALIHGDETTVTINRLSDGGTTAPDICMETDPPSSQISVCRNNSGGDGTREEINGIPGYQGLAASNNGGGNGELVEVRVNYPWKVLIPYLQNFFGSEQQDGNRSGVVMVTSATVIRNEPFE